MSAGAWHSAFVGEAGGVFMCGADESGQLGLHGPKLAATKVSAPPKLQQVPGQQGGTVVLGASCGGEHTVFVLKSIVDAEDDSYDSYEEGEEEDEDEDEDEEDVSA